MGEIGLPKTEYLFETDFTDLLLISRGYFRRFRSSWEQARLIAYHVNYCMGVGKGESVPTRQEWYPFPWDKEEDERPISVEEEENIQAELKRLRELNRQTV